jgi:two-component system sensor histidine kinase MprB
MTGPLPRVRHSVLAVDRRWRAAPLRSRLTAAAAFSATLAIVAVVAVAYVAVRHELLADLDGQLRHQSHEVHIDHSIQSNGVDLVPVMTISTQFGDVGGYLQTLEANGSTSNQGPHLPASSADVAVATNGGSSLHDAYVSGTHVRMLTVRLPASEAGSGVAVQLALPLTSVDHQLHKVATALLFLVLAGLGLATGGSWFAVRRTMRPVATLTEAAEQIAETRDLTTRIPHYGDDELGRLASTFNIMLDALERSLGQQRQLILDASHELRTPLASLRTNVEVLHDVERLPADQRRSLLDGIVTQLDELTGLVADVVELARGDAPESAQEIISLDDLVNHAVDRARRHWPNLVFMLHTERVVVRGIPARIDRAVANLLDNAGKFSPVGAVIDVDLTRDGTLAIADHGPGIREDALVQVFDRFYRADEARALPGSGLGLSIVKQVVDGHGGTVALTNRESGGTVARLWLPPVDDAATPGEVDSRQHPEPVGS